MAKKKKKPTNTSEEEIYGELDELNNPHYKAGCIFVASFFLLLYVTGIAFFWMFGTSTLRSGLKVQALKEAKTVEEIRDELYELFGSFTVDTSKIKEGVSEKVGEKVDQAKDEAARQAQEAISEKINEAVEETAESVSNGLELPEPLSE